MRRPVTSLLGVLALGGALLSAQSPAPNQSSQSQPPLPVFRSDVDAVLVDFTVVDREGRFVRGLTRDDVRVFEDDREQSVSAFSLVDIPIEPARPTTLDGVIVDRDAATNIGTEGRLYLIAIDDVHLDPLRTPVAKAIAREFIERHVGVHDRAALVAMTGRYAIAHEFTGNRQRLLDAVDKVQGGFGPFGVADRDRSSRTIVAASSQGSKSTFLYLESLSRWLAGVEGRRKTIVFISEGFSVDIPYDLPSPDLIDAAFIERPFTVDLRNLAPVDAAAIAADETDGHASVFDALGAMSDDAAYLRTVFEAAARANVSIYTVDPRGQPGAPWSSIRPVPNLQGDDAFSNRQRAGQQVLSILAAETGGFTLQHSNNFTAAFDRIVRETSSYYVLGYTSDNSSRDGKFRRIRLRPTKAGLRIRARTGYVAKKEVAPKKVPAGWTADHLTMLNSPEQASGLGLRVSAAPFRGAGDRSSVEVVVEARAEDVRSARAGAEANGGLTAVVVAANPDGDVKDSVRATFTPATDAGIREAVSRNGVRFLSRLELKPGRYALRVAAIDGAGAGSTKGSVYFDLDVPDFSKGRLSMSGVLLASRSAADTPTLGEHGDAGTFLGHPATALREFSSADELTTMVQVYDGERRRDHRIDVVTHVRRPDGTTVFSARDVYDRARGSARVEVVHSGRIPLDALTRGDYILTIDALTMLDKEQKASRQVVFSVR